MASAYKVLGQQAPGATTNVDLYTVPAATQVVASTIFVANRAATPASYRIAIRPNGATLAVEHYIAYDVPVAANDTTTITSGITLSAGDVVTVYGSSANLSFSIFGTEIS